MKHKLTVLLALASLFLAGVFALEVLAIPEGVTSIEWLASERNTARNGTAITAQAGNITWLRVNQTVQTIAWQGFVGNISGGLVLDDASADTFYNWNLTNISGEIYASRNSTIVWTTIFPNNNCYVDEILTGRFSDRVSRTFTASANTRNFSVGTIAINSSSACSVLIYVNDTRQSDTNFFENLILRTATGVLNYTVYTGLLELDGTSGFDTGEYNFQLIVPVNRTSGFTTYYMYAELD